MTAPPTALMCCGEREPLDALRHRVTNDVQQGDVDKCRCDVAEDGAAYYTQLLAAGTVAQIKAELLRRFVHVRRRSEINVQLVRFCADGGGDAAGCTCTVAKRTVQQRHGEKVLALVRDRGAGHTCATRFVAVLIVDRVGIGHAAAARMYDTIKGAAGCDSALPDKRACSANAARSCPCNANSASYSCGCTYSVYTNSCKYARSRKTGNKFRKLGKGETQRRASDAINTLSGTVAERLAAAAPAAHTAMTMHSHDAFHCRLGVDERAQRLCPFSGATLCADFSAHRHVDDANAMGCCTAIVTLLRPDASGMESGAQLHVLSRYAPVDAKCATPSRPAHARLLRSRRAATAPPATSVSATVTRGIIDERMLDDDTIGGLAIQLNSGSIVYEVSRMEQHATTAVAHADKRNPMRISVVFYLHRHLNEPEHGWQRCLRFKINKVEQCVANVMVHYECDPSAEGPVCKVDGCSEVLQWPRERQSAPACLYRHLACTHPSVYPMCGSTELEMKRRRLLAWAAFNRAADSKHAKCLLCDTVVGALDTTQAMRHLRRSGDSEHGAMYEQLMATEALMPDKRTAAAKRAAVKRTAACPRRKSAAWADFDELPISEMGVPQARCKHCSVVVPRPKSTTWTLHAHIKRCRKRPKQDKAAPTVEKGGGASEADGEHGADMDTAPAPVAGSVAQHVEPRAVTSHDLLWLNML